MSAPFVDYFAALNSSLKKPLPVHLFLIFFTCLVSWWFYVPVHELFHAFGCIIGGGEVTRLELSPVYGASFLKTIFPFVSAGSEYAGQLTGFNTFGNDLIFLLTDFFPYMLTILIGVPLIRSASSTDSTPLRSSIKLGVALPVAYAPFISAAGDYYEMGSIIASNITVLVSRSISGRHWRSDDLFRLADRLFFSGSSVSGYDIAGVTGSFFTGIVLVFFTYWTGSVWADLIFKQGRNP